MPSGAPPRERHGKNGPRSTPPESRRPRRPPSGRWPRRPPPRRRRRRKRAMPDRFRAVIRPLVTEKSSSAFGALKEYTFQADPRASKTEIRSAIEGLFGVHVVHIRTLQQRAKRKTRGRSQGIR